MWPFKPKPKPEAPEPRLSKRLMDHEDRLSELEMDLNNLTKRFQKLEGTIYGRKGAEVAAQSQEPLTKAQLRLQLGIVPGRVPPNLRS